jgi:hypothetical protein
MSRCTFLVLLLLLWPLLLVLLLLLLEAQHRAVPGAQLAPLQ